MDPGWTGSGLLDASHLPLLRVLMLWVWKASGEELASISKAELAQMAEEDGLPVRAMKRHLHQLCRQPRFRQRLLWADGSELTDNLDLDDLQAGLQDLQLVLLPCAETSSEQISELAEAVRNDSVLDVEAILHRPLNPHRKHGQMQVQCLGSSVCRGVGVSSPLEPRTSRSGFGHSFA